MFLHSWFSNENAEKSMFSDDHLLYNSLSVNYKKLFYNVYIKMTSIIHCNINSVYYNCSV